MLTIETTENIFMVGFEHNLPWLEVIQNNRLASAKVIPHLGFTKCVIKELFDNTSWPKNTTLMNGEIPKYLLAYETNGYAHLHENDMYVREIGRQISFARALESYYSFNPNSGIILQLVKGYYSRYEEFITTNLPDINDPLLTEVSKFLHLSEFDIMNTLVSYGFDGDNLQFSSRLESYRYHIFLSL